MEKRENKIQRFRIIYFKFKRSFNVLNTARNLKNIKTGKKDKRGIEMEKKIEENIGEMEARKPKTRK